MALKSDKNLKLYYSIREVAEMFDVNESLLRYWEKEFPIIAPKKAGGNIRQYTKEDIEKYIASHKSGGVSGKQLSKSAGGKGNKKAWSVVGMIGSLATGMTGGGDNSENI